MSAPVRTAPPTPWTPIGFIEAAGYLVPRRAGVYAILRVERLMGLPLESRVLYVGKSKDLRRRFNEHIVRPREPNPAIRKSGAHGEPGWEFWFRELPEESMDEVERALVRESQAAANTIRYGRTS